MSDTSRIPIPWTQRWRTIRFQVIPYVFFAVCVLSTIVLWNRHAGSPNAVGEVFAPRVDLTSTGEGPLLEIPGIDLFKTVRAGDVIARIDDKAIRSELETLTSGLQTFEADAKGTAEEMRLEQEDRIAKERSDRFRLQDMLNKASLEYKKARAQVMADQAQLDGLEKQLEAMDDANKKARATAIPLSLVWPLQTEQRMLKERILQNKSVMAEAQSQFVQTKKMIAEFPPEPTADLKVLTAKAETEAETQRTLIKAAELRRKSLEIRAPIDGVIATIYKRPGQIVKLGEPILTIAGSEGQFIISYMRQGRNLDPQPQMVVDIRRRVVPREMGKGFIEKIGSQVELVPQHQLREPRSIEWGVPVQIRIPPNLKLRPGEVVDLRLEPSEQLLQRSPLQQADQQYSSLPPRS